MPVSPRDFFINYVLAPYTAWCEDELCEWKAFATAGGINALVEHVFREANPAVPTKDEKYTKKLKHYRYKLGCTAEHRHIKYVVETYKHVERDKPREVPGRFDDMQVQPAGPFSKAFSHAFDVERLQLGFPYKPDSASSEQWVPLRRPVEKCIAHWKTHFSL